MKGWEHLKNFQQILIALANTYMWDVAGGEKERRHFDQGCH